jgi:hypothetical protein
MTGSHLVNQADDGHDDAIRRALEPYRQVRASERLRTAVTQPVGRARPPRAVRRPVRAVAAAAGVAALAAGVVAVAAIDGSGPGRTTDPETAGPATAGRTADISDARMVVFADGTTVPVAALFDPAEHERLQDVFTEHDAVLVIDARPVDPAADGRVFGVSVLNGRYDETRPDVIHLEAGVHVEVEVGRAHPTATSGEGLTLYEVFPAVEAAIDREDPVATGRALERLGFRVDWVLIEGAGVGHDVDTPPSGTVVLSVLGPEGQWTGIDPATDTLMVELASLQVARELGHAP